MSARSQAVTRPGGRRLSRQRDAAFDHAAPIPDPDAWRSTVRLLLDCPDLDARDLDALRRVTGWRRLGRIEEVWLATLARQHLGEAP